MAAESSSNVLMNNAAVPKNMSTVDEFIQGVLNFVIEDSQKLEHDDLKRRIETMIVASPNIHMRKILQVVLDRFNNKDIEISELEAFAHAICVIFPSDTQLTKILFEPEGEELIKIIKYSNILDTLRRRYNLSKPLQASRLAQLIALRLEEKKLDFEKYTDTHGRQFNNNRQIKLAETIIQKEDALTKLYAAHDERKRLHEPVGDLQQQIKDLIISLYHDGRTHHYKDSVKYKKYTSENSSKNPPPSRGIFYTHNNNEFRRRGGRTHRKRAHKRRTQRTQRKQRKH